MRINSSHLKLLIPFASIIFIVSCQNNQTKTNLLTKNWKFKNSVSNHWYQAIIPGSIHTDLYTNNLIPDPFTGNNEKSLQWIDTCDWVYQTSFNKPQGLKKGDHFELIFEGLDTYADIYLNDSLLFSANNMFIPWIRKIEFEKLKEENKLTLVFKSTLKEEQKKCKKGNF